MIYILLGIICGVLVCIFGIWCFIRGTQYNIELKQGNIPTQIKSPIQTVSEVIKQIKENAENTGNPTIEDQLKALFDDTPEDEKG